MLWVIGWPCFGVIQSFTIVLCAGIASLFGYLGCESCPLPTLVLDCPKARGFCAGLQKGVKIPQRFKSQSAGNQKVLENVENLFNLDQPLVGSSETKRASSSNEDVDFGDWLAGLIDGDGCLSFNGNVCRCEITLDAKDVQTLH